MEMNMPNKIAVILSLLFFFIQNKIKGCPMEQPYQIQK
jgi:hypothetical protein